jgi:hypothetical protein
MAQLSIHDLPMEKQLNEHEMEKLSGGIYWPPFSGTPLVLYGTIKRPFSCATPIEIP